MRLKGVGNPINTYSNPATRAVLLVGCMTLSPCSHWRTTRRSALLWAADAASLPLALAGGWAKAATSPYTLPQSFPLLRGQMPPALFHATAETGATGTVPSKSAEEDAAERKDPKRLPEGKLAPAEERRQQPIPQVHHDFAADDDKQQHP